MTKLSTFMAIKYLLFKGKDKNISFMIKICFWGILLGSFSLMLTLIIMNGFEKVIHEKMQGINAQAIIYSPGNQLDAEAIKKYLQTNFAKEIYEISASSTKQVLLEQKNQTNVLFLKGIEPEKEIHISKIEEKITLPPPPHNKLQQILQNDGILIGYKTAQQFHLKKGDSITLLIPSSKSKNKIGLKRKTAKIAGIFKIGLEEYDNNFAFCTLKFLKDLFQEQEGVDQLNIKFKQKQTSLDFQNLKRRFLLWIKDQTEEDIIIRQLRSALPGLIVASWKDLYPALVSSLKLEKYVMFFILMLIILVASMNMISLLFMQIQQKRKDIAIFKAMGMLDKNIRAIFLKIGMSITVTATGLGLLLAYTAGYLLDKYPFIELPDVYYVSHLPAKMDLEIFIAVFIATLIIGFFATYLPAKRTAKINIAQVLRQE